jgi:hypothetical protein
LHSVKLFFSSHHARGKVSTGPANVFSQETCAQCHTLAACQKRVLPLRLPTGLRILNARNSQPSVPYIPPTDLVITKEATESLKIKLQDGSGFNMTNYSRGNNEEYRALIVTVLCLCVINQKGLNVQCTKLGKDVVRLWNV